MGEKVNSCQNNVELTELLELTGSAFFKLDKDFNFVRVNSLHEKLVGLKSIEMLGRNFWELFFSDPETHNSLYWVRFHEAMMERRPIHFVEYYEGFKIWTDVNAYPTSDGGLAVFYRDVTEERKAADAVLALEQNYANAIESIDDGYFSLDKNWTITALNRAHELATKIKKADQIGKNFLELFLSIPGAKETKYWSAYHKAMNERVIVEFEDYYEALDLWTAVRAFPLADGGLSVFFTDISEKKRILMSIKESEEQFRTLSNSIPQLCWMAHADGHIFWYNQRWYDYTGKTPADLEGWGWQSVHDPAMLASVIERWKTSIATGNPFEMTFPLLSSEGKFRSFLTRVTPLRNEKNEIVRWFGTNTDVENSVRDKLALASERQKMEAIFYGSEVPMVLFKGPDLVFEMANPKYLEMVGNRNILGKPLTAGLPEVVGSEFPKIIRTVQQTGIPYRTLEEPTPLLNVTTGQLENKFFDSSFSRLTIDSDQNHLVIGHAMDVTERVHSRKELEAAKLDAERANHLKSAFLANMSHEIRTPLGAMMGFAELLGEQGATEIEKANYIDILQKNGAQLGHVINDILDLSKVETGHINFEYMKVSPLQIASEVMSLMSVLAKEKGLTLSLIDDGKTPDVIVTDPTRMRQVLMNLVSNALKFTKVGSIQITLSGYEGKDGAKCCAFEVIDTGAGIAPHAVDRLFKIFSQADNSMTRKFGGTGLGLALSRSLARAMGGDVRLVKSEILKGSTFHFSVESREDLLPALNQELNLQTTTAQKDLAPNLLNGIRVLLVEDSADNQQLIWRYLTKYGATVEIADNGDEGVKKAMSSEHDVVLMDLQMPVMDGYTATGQLRSRGYQTPIIALTAHAMADVRKKCQDVGCTDHLPKPINSRDLVEAVKVYGSSRH